jgi:hypothetical protein
LTGASIIALFSLSCGGLAYAAAPPWASECALLDDDAARLTCYDGHNPPHKSLATAQTPQRPPASNAPAAPAASRNAANDSFGRVAQSDSDNTKPAEPTDMIARVDSVSERLTGELLLKLDNGQSWLQAQSKRGVHIKAGERVTISRGALGGYLLSSDSGATMRVRRLQ